MVIINMSKISLGLGIYLCLGFIFSIMVYVALRIMYKDLLNDECTLYSVLCGLFFPIGIPLFFFICVFPLMVSYVGNMVMDIVKNKGWVILLKVIFLDVDGVLNCATSYSSCMDDELGTITGIDTDKVKRLSRIVNETDAKIVLSSTWRYGWEKAYKNYEEKPSHAKYLDKHLYKKGGIFIYDKTKDIDWFSRGEEIKEWVCRHNPDSWVVLDDEAFPDYYGNPYIEGRFVKTNWKYGIRDKDVDKAIEILNGGN